MKVLKFGGSSLKSAESINKVIDIIRNKTVTDKIAVVVSALAGVTDKLLALTYKEKISDNQRMNLLTDLYEQHTALGKKLLSRSRSQFLKEFDALFADFNTDLRKISGSQPNLRDTDKIISYGEKWSATLVAHLLQEYHIKGQTFFADEFLVTDENFGFANIRFYESGKFMTPLVKALSGETIPVITGFIGRTLKGETTTLGRNGSDYSATALAVLLNADLVEIWTDSDGILSADPAIFPEAVNLKSISFKEAHVLSGYKSDVLHPRTIQPLEMAGIPLLVKNVYNHAHQGTLITHKNEDSEISVKSIVIEAELQKIRIFGEQLEENDFFLDILKEVINRLGLPEIYHPGWNKCDVFVPENRKDEFILLMGSYLWQSRIANNFKILVSKDIYNLIGFVGENIHKNEALRQSILEIAQDQCSELVPLNSDYKKHKFEVLFKSANPYYMLSDLHQLLFRKPEIQLFVAGITGKVGQAFLRLMQQNGFLDDRYNFKLCGVINSKKYVIDRNGIEPAEVNRRILSGKAYNLNRFIEQAGQFPGTKLFIDITPAKIVANSYEKILLNSIGIVTANKIANSSNFISYLQLQALSQQKNLPFFYETNVGSATPVIELVKNLVHSKSRIAKIEATLSGTLAFIFSLLNKGVPFSEAVREAIEAGYCEPNPLIDLQCVDATRKMAILVREIGGQIDFDDIEREVLVPLHLTYENDKQILKQIEEYDGHWANRVDSAREKGNILTVIGSYEQNKASVRVKEVPENSIWNSVTFSENVFRIFINGLEDNPLTLIGAGAGTEWTAYGLIRDINRAAGFLAKNFRADCRPDYQFQRGEFYDEPVSRNKERVA